MGGKTHGKTTEIVLAEVKEAHGDNFIYDKFEYINANTKVTVGCNKHGELFYFDKWPNDLKQGSGCPKCSGNYRKTPEEFEKEIKNLWPLYTIMTPYKNAYTKVDVVCEKHSNFSVTPNDLLSGHGCIKCGVDRMLEHKIQTGQIRHPDLIPERDQYKLDVWRYTERSYKKHMITEKRDRHNHLDHVYSINDGFNNNVPPEIIGSIMNLRVISGQSNRSKSNKSDITLDELMELYNA
tara:strand:+ start:94 stop:804 length:711 start_codon:yes stop_codon:yes gene_type:complete